MSYLKDSNGKFLVLGGKYLWFYQPAVVITTPAYDILDITATGGGTITNTGGAEIWTKGVCWNTTGNPTINDYFSVTVDGNSGAGTYISPMNNLQAETHYYLRAWIDVNNIFVYGNQIEFDTIAEQEPPPPVESIILSHNQYYVTYDGAYDNDVLGVWNPWFPTYDSCTNATNIRFRIKNNVGTVPIFEINSTTGLITIDSSEYLKPLGSTTVQLTVESSIGSIYQDCSAYIKVMTTANCVFIDPGTSGTGTRVSPKSYPTTFTAGKAYLQKRGTTHTSRIVISDDGTFGNEITFGAYGTGAKPVVNPNSTSNDAFSIFGHYVSIYDFVLTRCQNGVQTESAENWQHNFCSHIDCSLMQGDDSNGGIYWKCNTTKGRTYNLTYNEMYDITSTNAVHHCVKVETGGNIARNVRVWKAIGNVGFSCAAQRNSYNTFSGISTHNNEASGIEFSGAYNTLSDSYVIDEYNGIKLDDPSIYASTISRCVVANSKYGIVLNGVDSRDLREGIKFVTIQDCEIKNGLTAHANSRGITVGYDSDYENDIDNIIIRRNKLYNNGYGIYIGGVKAGSDLSDVSIYNNILYSNTTDIYGGYGTNINIINNTGDGAINLIGTNTETVRNNFYKSLASAATYDHNIDIDDITVTDYFVDNANHNYHLKSTATNARDAGVAVAITTDYDGSTFANPPSIGAFEYFTDKD